MGNQEATMSLKESWTATKGHAMIPAMHGATTPRVPVCDSWLTR